MSVPPVDPPPTPSVAPARRRLGNFELLARIGQGGMADVFLARQMGPENFRKLMVIKRIHPHLARTRHFVDMFFDEARIAARISHPRVVQIYDLGEADDTYFIAMEYLAGQTLGEVLMHTKVANDPLDIGQVARIVSDAADGLHAAHDLRGGDGLPLDVVHRDVSPSNIIVLYEGTVSVVDFGVAKARGRLAETVAGQLKGKLAYMSPEQVTGRPVDRRSDVFALGVVLWESLTVRRLFRRANDGAMVNAVLNLPVRPPSAFNPACGELDAIALKALERDPDRRFQSAMEMRDALEEFLDARRSRGSAASLREYMQRSFRAQITSRQELVRTAESSETGDLALNLSELLAEPSFDTMELASETVGDGGAPLVSDHGVHGPVATSRGPAIAVAVAAVAVLALGAGWWAVGRPQAPTQIEARADAPPVPLGAPAPQESPAAQAEAPPAAQAADPPAHPPEPPAVPADEPVRAPAQRPLVKADDPPPKDATRPEHRIARKPPRVDGKPGSLYLATMPRSTIFLGKRELGATPLVNVPLPAGDHTVVAVDPASGARTKIQVHIEAEQETRLIRKLQD